MKGLTDVVSNYIPEFTKVIKTATAADLLKDPTQLVAALAGWQTGPKLYSIVANYINQAVLTVTETSIQFTKQLPQQISIPVIRVCGMHLK
ncbi:hypothetical protein ABBQ38_011701 [Trebouxia sp. C0009 RCD-2024]